jgi:hypothetical protein
MKPNPLTMTKITKNTRIEKIRKFGDGTFIAADDR